MSPTGSYEDHYRAHVRREILSVLETAPGNASNSRILRSALSHLGMALTGDQVRTELAWMAEQGLLRVETLDPALHRATLTERGVDVACGHARSPGVADRPMGG